jgi:hypothetical protein
MNVAAPINRAFFPLMRLLFRWIPEKSRAAFLIVSALPCFLFLLNLGASFLKPCAFTPFLPFLVLVAALVTYRFKLFGLLASCCAFFLLFFLAYPNLDPSQRLWQAGILCNFSLSLFVLWLCSEEASFYLVEYETGSQEMSKKLAQSEADLQLLMKSASEQEKELKEEIERLKSEAQQRRIEKIQEAKHLALINSEIEMLTAHKNSFIESALKAKQEALHNQELLAEYEKKLVEATINANDALAHQKKRYDELEVTYETLQKSLSDQKQQLRQCEEDAHLEKQLMEEQHVEMLRQHKEAIIDLQERLLKIQQLPLKVEIQTMKVVEEDAELKKAYVLLENSLKQLRLQFNEKSENLSQTRKELFATETKLLTFEKEKSLTHFEPAGEEAKALETVIAHLCMEIELLEQEVSQLENLICNGPQKLDR